MSHQPIEPQTPKPAQPFNRRYRSQGDSLPPAGSMRTNDRRHLVTQERIGVLLVLLVFYATGYGITRDFLEPLLWVGGVALVMFLWPTRRRRYRLEKGRAREQFEANEAKRSS